MPQFPRLHSEDGRVPGATVRPRATAAGARNCEGYCDRPRFTIRLLLLLLPLVFTQICPEAPSGLQPGRREGRCSQTSPVSAWSGGGGWARCPLPWRAAGCPHSRHNRTYRQGSGGQSVSLVGLEAPGLGSGQAGSGMRGVVGWAAHRSVLGLPFLHLQHGGGDGRCYVSRTVPGPPR